MREIRFKVWCIDGNCWIDLYDINRYSDTNFEGESLHSLGCTIYNYPTNEFILVQYTGLKDKNGKEIYEGDIIKITTKDDVIYSTIYFKSGGFIFTDPQGSRHLIGWYLDWLSPESGYVEVVGNKFENPDMLTY
jgi:uncharacterized phage protein (TIGR01671 family)